LVSVTLPKAAKSTLLIERFIALHIILDVDRARSLVVLKRGHGRGFSGLENPLFTTPNLRHGLR